MFCHLIVLVFCSIVLSLSRIALGFVLLKGDWMKDNCIAY